MDLETVATIVVFQVARKHRPKSCHELQQKPFLLDSREQVGCSKCLVRGAVANIVRQVLQSERHFNLGRGLRRHPSTQGAWYVLA